VLRPAGTESMHDWLPPADPSSLRQHRFGMGADGGGADGGSDGGSEDGDEGNAEGGRAGGEVGDGGGGGAVGGGGAGTHMPLTIMAGSIN